MTSMRVITTADMHGVMARCLHAAISLHTAMCLIDDDHRAQVPLNNTLQAILEAAEQCRVLHANPLRAVAPEEPPEVELLKTKDEKNEIPD
jgi:hypothetical protein